MRPMPPHLAMALALVLPCILAINGCDRSPNPQEIEGVWKISDEARELLHLSADSLGGSVTFMPDGRLRVEMIPPIFVGSPKKSLVTAEGTWEVAKDASASIRMTLQVDGGQVQSILDVVKVDGRTLLAVWLDQPGGQYLGLQRARGLSNQTR